MRILCLIITALALQSLSPANAIQVPLLGSDYSIPKVHLQNGKPSGVLISILQYMDTQLVNYEFTYQLYPWARAYRSALVGEGGIIALSKTDERLAIFDYSDPIFIDEVIMVVRKTDVFTYRGIADLAGRKVGIGRDGSFGEEYEHAKKAGKLVIEEDNGPVQRLRKLLGGRIDVAFINPGRLAYELTVQSDPFLYAHQQKMAILATPFKHDVNYLGFAKKLNMKPFIQQFNTALRKGYQTGAIQKILVNYRDPIQNQQW
ncbi:transporter substrate-binding domain-containing protein [Chitinivorax sp. B]|uniref:substrate-binding periplasmic protein n=1 Tax=Chitinivorax sp. B TaxID=2502235 RepID=UPI001484ECB4|nr:transporter substrate-binding domain-containing protein [Chitinivorax sp. B]